MKTPIECRWKGHRIIFGILVIWLVDEFGVHEVDTHVVIIISFLDKLQQVYTVLQLQILT